MFVPVPGELCTHKTRTGREYIYLSFAILHFLLLPSLACSARDPFSVILHFTFSQDPHFPACVLIFLIGILFPSGSIFPISHTFSTEILFPSYYIIFTPGSIFSIGFNRGYLEGPVLAGGYSQTASPKSKFSAKTAVFRARPRKRPSVTRKRPCRSGPDPAT